MLRTLLTAGALAAGMTVAAAAQTIDIHDAYARSVSPAAQSGAAFMVFYNTGTTDDRLVAASAPVAARVELHTHIEDAGGVMRMIEIEDGIVVPAGGRAVLRRGGDHVMLMGLTGPLEQGADFPLTLVFERAGEIVIDVTVDSERQPEHGAHGTDHGAHHSPGQKHSGH